MESRRTLQGADTHLSLQKPKGVHADAAAKVDVLVAVKILGGGAVPALDCNGEPVIGVGDKRAVFFVSYFIFQNRREGTHWQKI